MPSTTRNMRKDGGKAEFITKPKRKMETKYLLAMRLLLRGLNYLVVSFYRTVMAHKALTAFIISLLLNIHLFVSLAQARIERDQASRRMAQIEILNYSLEGRNIKYYNYNE